jgi:murein DD-endopeptidase MepM/ murein hydrolase activator NlpD
MHTKDVSHTATHKDPGLNPNEREDKELKKACRDFESVFTYQLLKSMRRTVEKCDLFHGGPGEDIYESMLDQELAKDLAGVGPSSLGNLLYQQLRGGHPGAVEQVTAAGGAGRRPPQWPLRTQEISSGFGWRRRPLSGRDQFHRGVDLPAKAGTMVRASLSGTVVRSEYQDGYGNLVELDHGPGFSTLYAHNQVNLVEAGAWVKRGAPLARVGSSGRTTGSHLHFEVQKRGRHLDPQRFLGSGPATPVRESPR